MTTVITRGETLVSILSPWLKICDVKTELGIGCREQGPGSRTEEPSSEQESGGRMKQKSGCSPGRTNIPKVEMPSL